MQIRRSSVAFFLFSMSQKKMEIEESNFRGWKSRRCYLYAD